MFAPAAALLITPEQRQQLEALARAGTTSQSVARKCRALLLAGDGVPNNSIAKQTGLSRPTILAIRAAFSRAGVDAVAGRQERNRKPSVLTAGVEQKILDATLKTRPADA